MKTKRLGRTALELTRIGLGTWAIGGSWEWGWGPQDDNDSLKTILEAIAEGINWIDTAPIYGCGHSEEIIGQVLKQTKQKPLIATKFGLLWNTEREKQECLKRKSVRAECEASLKRLGVDVIDLYQMHWGEPDSDIEEAWEEIARLADEGKIRYAGMSNCTIEQMKRCLRIFPVSSLQPPYSMIRRDVGKEMLGFCAKNDIGVIVYSPLQKGLLTGKFSAKRMEEMPADDHRHFDPNFREPRLGANLQLVESLRDIVKRNGRTVGELAVAWTLQRDEVTAAIVGARRPGQIKETLAAADWYLTAADIEEIEELLADRQERIQRNTT